MDGKLHVYRRENSRFWQCSTFLGGRNHRQTTKETSLQLAQEFAREWYMERYVDERRRRRGGVAMAQPAHAEVGTDTPLEERRRRTPSGPTFRQAAEAFTKEFEVITLGERNADYVASKTRDLNVHLLPFFGDSALSEISAGKIQDYRTHRATSRIDKKTGEPKRPARSTLHHEIVTLRQVLKTANRKGWLAALPDMSAPYKQSGKIAHRAWFSPEEYKMLYEATRERAKNPKKERWRAVCEQMHDYVLFMVNTGLRPDEASNLQFRDVRIVKDLNMGGERILEIEVRGKRGVGFCKSMPGAVMPFQRVQKRQGDPKLTDLLFGEVQRELFNSILNELDLKRDRQGNVRTAYSLRHTYISMRLMEGADIYAIARNCRTSVEMIEKHYAVHIKNVLDTSVINTRKTKSAFAPRTKRKPKSEPEAEEA